MSDLLRLIVFALCLGSVVGSSVALVGPWRLGATGTLLAFWVVATGQIVLVAEALSLAHALDWPGFVAGHLLITLGTAAWAWRRPRRSRWCALDQVGAGLRRIAPLVRDWRRPALPILIGVLLAVGAVSTVSAFWVPPNNPDVLGYHLSRVAYYLQFRSLDVYPTENPRQTFLAANAEILKLWTVALLRWDQLANGVQLAAWCFSGAAVYGVGRQVGLASRAAVLGAGLFLLLPQSVLQSSSSLNDLVVVSFIGASFFFVLQAARAERPIAALGLAGAAAGLAIGVKATALLAVPGLAVAAVALLGRRIIGRRSELARGSVAAGLLLGGLAGGALGSYFYVQSWYVFGSPIGPTGASEGGGPADADAEPGSGAAPETPATPPEPQAAALELQAAAPTGASAAALPLKRVAAPSAAMAQAPAATPTPTEAPTADPVAAPASPWLSFRTNLGRNIYTFAFADLSGPLADARARPLAGPLVQAYAGGGRWVFAQLGLPERLEGLDLPYWPAFRFDREPNVHVFVSGVGQVGGLMLLSAAAALLWPRRTPVGQRILAFGALSYVAAMTWTSPWNPYGAGRFLLTACAIAAPMLGLVLQRAGAWRQALAVVLVAWSGAVGLYAASFNAEKPLSRLATADRLALRYNGAPRILALFREMDAELGPAATVGVYGDQEPGRWAIHWEYPFFGPRLDRTILPLVAPAYAQRLGIRRPLPWTNDELVATHRPDFIVVFGRGSGAEELPELLGGPCFELPLEGGRPRSLWELWRCEDRDPRSVLANGDFAAGADATGPVRADQARPAAVADGWQARAAGGASLEVAQLEPPPSGEPFRLRLAYRGGDGGGIVGTIPVDDRLRGATLVVDARVLTDRPDAALLRVADGVASSSAVNRAAGPETLRVRHRVDERATQIQVALVAAEPARDTQILVRSILAIPR